MICEQLIANQPWRVTLTVLDWRSKEVLAADWLAASRRLQHFVVAVKHSLETFHDLLYTPKMRLYLSHPITEARELANRGRIEEARRFALTIRDITERLRTKYVVFEPTSIDELRLRGGETRPSSRLDARWPFEMPDFKRLLYAPPKARVTEFAFPIGWEADGEDTTEPTALTKELWTAISEQINARDHALVEQSERIACYRPLYQGNASRGVKEEIDYMNRLVKLGVKPDSSSVFVFSPADDRGRYPVRQLAEKRIPAWHQSKKITGTDEDVKRLQVSLLEGRQDLTALLSGDHGALIRMLEDHKLSVAAESDRVPSGALGATPEARRDAAAQELAEDVNKWSADYLTRPDLKTLVREVATEDAFLNDLGL